MSRAHAIRDKLKGLAFNYAWEYYIVPLACCSLDSVQAMHKQLVLESVALDHLSGYESRLTCESCSICKPKPIITLSYQRMMLRPQAPAHPSVLSCAVELLYTWGLKVLNVDNFQSSNTPFDLFLDNDGPFLF